jgi:hypothetical protein
MECWSDGIVFSLRAFVAAARAEAGIDRSESHGVGLLDVIYTAS